MRSTDMGARDFIPSGGIRLQLRSHTKEEVIRELVSLLESEGELRSRFRFEALSRSRLAFGRAPEGIDFKAIDGEPVYYLFMLLGPKPDPTNDFLPLLGHLATWFRKPGVTERLRELETPEALLRLLDDEGVWSGKPIDLP
ncbi:MAG: PTS sugar transporter subunit IIA [Gemmatimonadales bacterium]|nr:PTS sugar transporter subunit IIA [Gemmatimonadales bacterium]